ncbi:MAG: hypothetical protein JWO56_781, partial [Acidobacteria bacterium]|nr:hypothetical protein [Acidobacteriota bacterium]
MKMRIAGLLASVTLRVLHLTLRVRHVNVRVAHETPRSIFAFWHAHMLLMLHSKYRLPMTVMSSSSRDGDLAVWTYRTYGVDAVRGSSTRGGQAAIRAAIRRARNGSNLSFTPDGPKGPPRVVKDGVIFAAQMTGLPIIPVAFGADRKKLLNSWDRMVFAKPFSRAVYLYGEPIFVPREANIEEARLQLERAMTGLAARVETDFESVWK